MKQEESKIHVTITDERRIIIKFPDETSVTLREKFKRDKVQAFSSYYFFHKSIRYNITIYYEPYIVIYMFYKPHTSDREMLFPEYDPDMKI